jgi:hypothetical protein
MFTKQYRLRLRAVLFYQWFRQFGGINYFDFYSVKIFDELGQNGAVANMVVCFGRLMGGILCMYFAGS